MTRVAVVSFSDGRDFVHREVAEAVLQQQDRLAGGLRARGVEVVVASEPVTSNTLAVAMSREVAGRRPDLTVFNYPVWSFPHFTMLAADSTPGELMLFSNIDPAYPGMVAMLAAGGSLDQLGRRAARAWGEADDSGVLDRLEGRARAARAVAGLRGTTFGRIGGRSMGMYTAVGRTDEWMSRFGVDVEEIDQYEIVRRAELVPPARARAGREWLESHCAGVHYDGAQLTPELLERQVRSYHAVQELIEEWGLDFTGIKGQPELTNSFATMDVTEAFLNDPYDWEGPKEPQVCATEVDMDGALTMQLLKLLTGQPVLFADVRHYFAERGIWDLVNSGQHATWYAARSDDPAENLRQVHLYPEDFYFPAGGASVHHLAAPGEMTFARLSRKAGRYRMQVTRGAFERYDEEENEDLMRRSTYHWPHAFTRFAAGAEAILSRFGANHVHAVPGDLTGELAAVCEMLDVDLDRLDG